MNFSADNEKNNKMSKALKYGGWIILILSPVLLLFIQSMYYGRNLFLSVPQWSDELDYWREMFSFANNGFNFGGSLFVGMDAEIGPMGAHSFSPIAAWGLFFWLFKLSSAPYAIVWANLIIITVAWVIFVALLKPDLQVTLIAVGMSFLYPLTLIYIQTSMIELVCMAGMIVYFSLLYKWEQDNRNLWFVLLMVVGIWCISVRITYVVILFPIIWKKNKFKFNLSTIISMIAYVLLFGVFYKVYGLFCAGYPGWTTEKISKADGLIRKAGVIFDNTKMNLYRLLSPFSADRAQVGMRYLYLIILVILIVLSFSRKDNHDLTDEKRVDCLNLSLAIMLAGLLVMMVSLYDIRDWRDFRTFAPLVFGVILFEMMRMQFSKKWLVILGAAFSFMFLMYISSGITIISEKESVEVVDLSEYFEKLETYDAEGTPRKLGIEKQLNWCDISVMNSIPSELGVQIFYDEITGDIIEKTDYILVSHSLYELNSDLYGEYEVISSVPNYGVIIKTFD